MINILQVQHQICAYDSDKLVGVSIFRMKDGKIHMNYSSVDEAYRNQGINKKMKLKIIEIGRENGCTVITSKDWIWTMLGCLPVLLTQIK